MRCDNCGAPLPDGAMICGECGRTVTQSAVRRTQAPTAGSVTSPPPLQAPGPHGTRQDPASEAWFPESTLDPATRAWLTGAARSRTEQPGDPIVDGATGEVDVDFLPRSAPEHVHGADSGLADWTRSPADDGVPLGDIEAAAREAVTDAESLVDREPVADGASPVNARSSIDVESAAGAQFSVGAESAVAREAALAEARAREDAVRAAAAAENARQLAEAQAIARARAAEAAEATERAAAQAATPAAAPDAAVSAPDAAVSGQDAPQSAPAGPAWWIDRGPAAPSEHAEPAVTPSEPADRAGDGAADVDAVVPGAELADAEPSETPNADATPSDATPSDAAQSDAAQPDSTPLVDPSSPLSRPVSELADSAAADTQVPAAPRPGDTAVVTPIGNRRTFERPPSLIAPGSQAATCHVCGHRLEPDDIFCEECGNVVPAVTAAFTGPIVPLPLERPDWAVSASGDNSVAGAIAADVHGDVLAEDDRDAIDRSEPADRDHVDTVHAESGPTDLDPDPDDLIVEHPAATTVTRTDDPLPDLPPLPPMPQSDATPSWRRSSRPIVPAEQDDHGTDRHVGDGGMHDTDDVEATRIVTRGPQRDPVVLHFSTGERAVLPGSALVGRLPRPEPTEHFDDLVTIVDPGKSVSKTHLEVGRDGDDFWVSDRYSGNGTVVRHLDGTSRRCEPGLRYRVERGARVDIGEQFFLVQ